ncbi:MAG TPA: alkaline shock response membrane anchor protein AmaP [Clostridia bacterium]|nr:MAG: hypothetical protein BWX97_02169 [Firmicutes bacterium ADurb.Bin146]HOD92513.1 alkaline shock response membrane anchor protein AmaP [Clostridia bacterium]HQM39171.1 alkaline shock response membrane anchor protein AmaP [Clostridia bacterium]
MKVIKKAKNLFYGVNIILIVSICIMVIYACLDPLDFEKAFENFVDAKFFSVQRGIVFLAALLVIAFEMLFIWSLMQKEDKPAETVNITTSSGQISIAVYSLEVLAKMEVEQFDAVTDIRTKVNLKDSQVGMDVYVKVMPSVLIPEISSKIQNAVKEKILKGTGIDLNNIRVFVDGIAGIS